MPILNWLTREEDIQRASRAPYRLLEEVPALSYGDPDAENMLIQGDNLDALKALLPYYAGKVRCIYIDPPFNTMSAFDHYDDNLEHSIWLAIMYPRLELLHKLLSEDGSLWISIDDNELAYLTVIADEIFGRRNRVFLATFKQSSASGPKAINPGVVTTCSYVICYAKNKSNWKYNKVHTVKKRDSRYSKIITNVDEHYDNWKLNPLIKNFVERIGAASIKDAKTMLGETFEEKLHAYVIEKSASVVRTARIAEKDVNEEARNALRLSTMQREKIFCCKRTDFDNQYFINGEQLIFYKNKVKNIDGIESTAEPLTNLWDDLLSNNLHNEGQVAFKNGKKPEGLVKRIIESATVENDWVLDSFLGSGTSAAVAHKMGRRYIGIEKGEHASTHCGPRLQKVIGGEQSGISKAVEWKGGGGFRFYRLGEPVFDETGHVSPSIRFGNLAAHLWFAETGQPLVAQPTVPFLGEYEGTGYYLLFNGILGDKRPDGGNILTSRILAQLPSFVGPKVIFGEGCRMGAERLSKEQITFRHIPYEISAR